jgi:nitrate reductase cytochrome c-type subunit
MKQIQNKTNKKQKAKGKNKTSGSKEKRRLKSMRGPPQIPHVIFSSYSTDSSCHFCEVLHRFLMSFLRGTPQIPHVILIW